ncbi:hypothetical protein Heshes_26320 [Alicyclobacillus hesperidum]|uniref:Uncharacterized protein n=1 Tax=Alicyclobacillus hesperidum TaxID=89784 RepID=A0AA37X4F7_9BACL|nr:hypothetical protein Heshes_26320 [Alicyclobacillus hesperidum]
MADLQKLGKAEPVPALCTEGLAYLPVISLDNNSLWQLTGYHTGMVQFS